ncbi:hypothetical protein ACFE04_019378 [Oxalis oulophora]
MENDYYNLHSSSTRVAIKHKLMSSISCFSTTKSEPSSPTSPKSPYTCLKSTAHDHLHIKDKCRHLFSTICKHHHHHISSADLKYDPMSYTLNFEDEFREHDALPFSSRLPRSPDRESPVTLM